ncbi:MAG: proline--tRNA ligase [Candidatus Parcubacteria bacterium]|nr:MAG: proline--tRNA ligase [Candidatus Parcubacteria bacterium]
MVQIGKGNFSDWYINLILKANLIDYGPVKGTIVFKPYGYRIWEKLMFIVDNEIKQFGTQNVYFPIFIPESFLSKEKEHLEGFSPEVAVVTYAGGEELKEKLIVRPTSETIMYPIVAKWIKSYRDLPLIINQWTNVIRWEKRPFPFIRNTEFLWHEGHSLHSSHQSALELVFKVLAMYQKIYQDVLCIYGVSGRKSESEKFAGALATYTYEILMPDGKALQGCTSHDLGQNFAKVFNVRFQDKDKKLKYVWQTSWAITTRAIGALIGVHGDDYGLILPPKIAPYQVVVIPIYDKKHDKKIRAFIEDIQKELTQVYISVSSALFPRLSALDIYVDDSEHTPGYKFNEWELKGAPLRIEIGYQELKNQTLTCFRRDKRERFKLKLNELKNNLSNIFTEIEKNLFLRSKEFTEKNTYFVKDYQEFKKIMKTKRGFIQAYWCEKEECESKIKEETKATTRCLPLDIKNSRITNYKLRLTNYSSKGKCVYCGKKARNVWLFAQSY